MRVISGDSKGKKLVDNKFSHIRPTTDKVKQALFTKLQFFIEEKRVLDLFAGTGALGIEALSRKASEVVFVDSNIKSVLLIKQNLKNLGLQAKVIKSDALKFLNQKIGKFDLIILDPPYASKLYEPALEKIAEQDLLEDDGIIVCEHEKNEKIDFSAFTVFDEKRYGNIVLTYLKK